MSNGEQKTTRPAGRGDSPGGVQSVDRAITVLEILAREGSAGVSEVAAEIGVHKSTAFRLLAALEERDLVEQNTDRGKYQLAFGILRLASSIPARIDLVRQSRPLLDALAADLDETINIAVVREHYAVNVQQAMGTAAVASQNWVGQLTPLHATASGKVLLAYMPAEQIDAIIREAGLPQLTPHTITRARSWMRSWPRSATAASRRPTRSSKRDSTPRRSRSATTPAASWRPSARRARRSASTTPRSSGPPTP